MKRRRTKKTPAALLAFASTFASIVLGSHVRSFAAGPYDPEVEFRTLTTPNFFVTYPEGYDHIALRAGTIAERALPYLTSRYGHRLSGRTSIVINDQTDFANGSATIIPTKVITIFVTAPTEVSGLEDYDDWLTTVITHELSHIVHLDMAYGLPWLGRYFFGKYVSMNAYTPRWVTEGFAVYEETVSSGSGRGRSAYVDMVIRMAALEDKFPGIDQGYSGYPNWPFTNIAYFIGGRFQLWLMERYGEAALIRYHHAYAADPIPYFTWLPAEIAFGSSLESLWSAFEHEMREDAELTLETLRGSTMGLTEPKRLTRYGGDLLGPRITPDGEHIIFSTNSPVDGPRMRRIRIDGSGDEVLVDDTFSKQISFTPDGKAFYFQQTEINQRFYTHNSILRYDLGAETFSRVEIDPLETSGFVAPSGSLRARDPDVSPDGKQIVFVQAPYGSNRLVLAWLESDGTTVHPKEIVPAEPDVQLSDPRFSPDGKRIAVSRFKGGRRDIVLFDTEGNLLLEITRDRAQDIDPTWTRDGRWLVFASDVTGIYNLFAYDLEKTELRQLTNLVGGGYQPCISRDGKTIIYRGYSADGFDVYEVPFDPERGALVPIARMTADDFDAAPRRWPPQNAAAPDVPPPAPFTGTPLPDTLPEGWSIDEYTALDTILPFTNFPDRWNLFPTLSANENEISGGLTHFGTDALGTQQYALSLAYGTKTDFVGGGAAYINNQLEPTFGFLATAEAVTFPRKVIVAQSPSDPCPFDDQPLDDRGTRFCFGHNQDGDYNERRLTGAFSIGLPVLQRHFITLSYILQQRQALDDLPDATIPSILPRAGRFARVQLGYTYANVRAFPYSISLERGSSFAIALQGLSKGLGSDYEEVVLTTEGRYYLTLPWTERWLRNHVIAARIGLGVSGGPDLAESFRLGGVSGSSALTTTTENFHGLRGLAFGALQGTGVISGSLEYRAPLFRFDRGPGTLPLTVRVLHAALFADLGRTFEKVSLDALKHGFFESFLVGAGAELRADITIAYSLSLTLILGYAHAIVTPDGFDPTLKASPPYYFQLGTTF